MSNIAGNQTLAYLFVYSDLPSYSLVSRFGFHVRRGFSSSNYIRYDNGINEFRLCENSTTTTMPFQNYGVQKKVFDITKMF